jgi:DNA-directed RNA polymerase subunit RPC12/RpoP
MEKSFGTGDLTVAVTVIVECSRCSGLFLAGVEQKSRTCPFCGVRIELQKAKRLASAQNAFEASELLKKIKIDRQLNTKKSKTKITHL